jgi:hypothetical protein
MFKIEKTVAAVALAAVFSVSAMPGANAAAYRTPGAAALKHTLAAYKRLHHAVPDPRADKTFVPPQRDPFDNSSNGG